LAFPLHISDAVNQVRRSQVVDDTERLTSFTALDRHCRNWGQFHGLSSSAAIYN